MTTTTAQATKISHDGDLNWANGGDISTCVQCGKKIGKNPLWVCVYNGGFVWAASEGEPDESHPGYMGYYPVGSTCANQFAAGVLTHEGGVA